MWNNSDLKIWALLENNIKKKKKKKKGWGSFEFVSFFPFINVSEVTDSIKESMDNLRNPSQ